MDVGMRSLSSDKNLSGAFGDSRGGIWLRDNCWRFGFVIRYQEGWEEITGYSPEPWHIRYVGLEAAEKLHENNMPLEEFLLLERTAVMLELLSQNQESGE
jgi:LAS superfamily LD-carboxypeptidase LdcB